MGEPHRRWPGALSARSGCYGLHHVYGGWLHERGHHGRPAGLFRGRVSFAKDELLGGSAEERAAAQASYLSYAGPYAVREDRVIHYVEISLFPNWVGSAQERFYSFEGDRLTLSAAPMSVGGIERRAYLIWERAT